MSRADEVTPLLQVTTMDTETLPNTSLSVDSCPSKIVPTIVYYTGIPGEDQPHLLPLLTRTGHPATSLHTASGMITIFKGDKKRVSQAFDASSAGAKEWMNLLADTDIPLREMPGMLASKPGMSECSFVIMGPEWRLPGKRFYNNLLKHRPFDANTAEEKGEFRPAIKMKTDDTGKVTAIFPYVRDDSSRPVHSSSGNSKWRQAMDSACEIRNSGWDALEQNSSLTVEALIKEMSDTAKSENLGVPEFYTSREKEFDEWVQKRVHRSKGSMSESGPYLPSGLRNAQRQPSPDSD